MQIAVVDIGSNSIRYMEAGSGPDGFGFSSKSVHTTRLAEGQGQDKKLTLPSMERSVSVLKDLARKSSDRGLPCYCYATSAVREASNRETFLEMVSSSTGLSIDVLSGKDEARFAYEAAMADGGGLIDIGGGSFQITTEEDQISFPVGCVRIHDICPCQTLASLNETVLPRLPDLSSVRLPKKDIWKAVGGTATTLGALSLGLDRYDPAAVSKAVFAESSLLELLDRLDRLGDQKRSENPLLIKRHDVILGGGFLLLYIMRSLHIASISTCDADGLEGYAVHILSSVK